MLASILIDLIAGPAGIQNATRCLVAESVIAEAFPRTSFPLALEHGLNTFQIKYVVKQFGDQLTKSFSSAAYHKDGSVGWVAFGSNRKPIGVDPPHEQTLNAFMQSPIIEASSRCPNLAPLTSRLGWTKPFHFRRPKNRSSLDPYSSVSMSLPVTGARNDEAITWIDETSGPLAGTSYLLLLRRSHSGTWRATGFFPIGVS